MTRVAGDAGPRVVLYTTSWCPHCHSAKALLERRGIAYQEVDGEQVWGTRFRDEIEKRTGGRTVPQVVIDGRPIGGNAELHQLDDEGGLKKLLGKPAPRAGAD